jgi:hypothetical protein
MLAIVACTTGYAACIGRAGASKRRVLLEALGLQVLAGLVAFCGTALIYLPFLENLGVTETLSSYRQRIFYPASAHALLSLFSPTHFFESYHAADADAVRVSGNTVFHYGSIGLGLAACAWRRGPNWLRPLVLTLLGIVVVVAGRIFAVPGIAALMNSVFVVRNLGEQYIFVALSVALALLVAFGTHNVLKREFSLVPVVLVAALAGLGAVLAAHAYGMGPSAANCDPWLETCPAWSVGTIEALLAVLVMALWLSQRLRGIRWVLVPLLVVLMFLDLALGAKSVRFGERDIFADPTSDVLYLKDHAGLARTMTLGAYATSMDFGSAFQFQEVTSLNPGTMTGYRKYFMEMTRGVPPESRWGDFVSLGMPQTHASFGYYDWFMVSLLGVKYVIAPSTYTSLFDEARAKGFPIRHVSRFTTVIENPAAFPRAFVWPTETVPGADVQIPANTTAKDVVPVRIVSYGNASVVLEGETRTPAAIVLTDNWHPRWRATVNGKGVAMVTVQGTFRGVPVPPGKFRIEMWYRPQTLPLAIGLSVLAWLFVAGGLLEGLRRRWFARA